MADPFGMTGLPGSNTGGTQTGAPAPSPSGTSTSPIGSNPSPFAPVPPTGQSVPSLTSPIATSNPSNFDVASLLGFGQGTNNPLHDITKALQKAGFSAGIAGELADFLKSGAGFNPAVAQALIAAMQPGIDRGQANILEQFSGMGLREGSPAAIGLGDFMSQVQLNEGQIWAQLYEQSVQNYMSVLESGKGKPPQNMFQNVNEMLSTLAKFLPGGGGGSSGGGGGTPNYPTPDYNTIDMSHA